jgi:protein gp37
MAQNSKIEWTEATWNPTTGCTKNSDGCLNCYACTMAQRLQAMRNIRYKNGFNVTLHEDLIDLPLKWIKPRKIFVNSMSDLFHEEIPDEFIYKVFNTMNRADQHIFQVLTKSTDRLEKISRQVNWTPNIWQGITVESYKYIERISVLQRIPAQVKFISFEPLLSEIPNLNLNGINWAIVGGESGKNARPMKEEWAVSIKNQCIDQNVSFFFKQWGGFNKKANGRILEGKTWDDYPINE